ncbi:unnamed protein product [Parnassius apollo]|uniref:(apollo) hypothetical protein n=1 Tax=Parnassius apollo TaxID=110799 RepID=A0A8S3W3Q3_PARAO|nr:unnamed protein product [Parnassius apollo]
MRSALCYVLLQVYVFALATNPRSVDVALETTFEFNNKQDVEIIEKVRNFLSKIEAAVDKKFVLRGVSRDVKYEFRDFLEELITTLNSYNDSDFKEVFKLLYEEIRDQRYKRSKFNELFDNEDLRYITFEVLNKINEAPVQLLRIRMKKFLKSLNSTRTDNQNTNFINFFNFLYKNKSRKKFKKVLRKFKRYGERPAESDLNLKDIIRSTLNFLIYDHFNNLDDSIRHDVKAWLGSIRQNSHFKTTSKKLTDIKRSKKGKVKSITTKKRFKNRNTNLQATSHKTFVTLYPEAIVFNTKKKLKRISPVPLWKERTASNRNYLYLVRDSNATDTIKENVFDKDVANQSENTSSDSPEFRWRATNTRWKDSTKLYDQFENQQKTMTHMLSPPIPSKSFTLENLNTSKTQEPRRNAYKNDEDLSNEKANESGLKESASAKYLDRIKKIEEELNEMKKEIKAKIYSRTKQYTTETIQLLDEYKGFIGREEDIYPSKTSDVSVVDRKYAENTSEHSHLRNETSKSDLVFRSDKFNNMKENDIFGDELLLRDTKEVTSVDVVHSATIKPELSTLNINISSRVGENSTIFTDHIPKSTELIAPKTETVTLPVVSESDTKILIEEVNVPKNVTFTQMPVNVESDITVSKEFSNKSSSLGYAEHISLKI